MIELKKVVVKEGKVFAAGGQLNHGVEIVDGEFTWQYLAHSHIGPQIRCFYKGQYVKYASKLDKDGIWTFKAKLNSDGSAAMKGFWMTLDERNPVLRAIRKYVTPNQKMVKVVGDEDMFADIQSVSGALPKNVKILGFVTDGTEISQESFNYSSSCPDRGRIHNATFCIQYSTRVDRDGTIHRFIENVQVKSPEAVSPVVFEKALHAVMKEKDKMPAVQVTTGSADPEPGNKTVMSDLLASVKV